MEEIMRLAIECVEELLKLSPEEIKEIRHEWIQRLYSERGGQNLPRVESFINNICDYAIQKLIQKTA